MARMRRQEALVRVVALACLFDFSIGQNTTTSSAGSFQTFVTQPDLHPPVFEISKLGETESGYIFVNPASQNGADETFVATIITDEGQLVWSADPTLATGDLSLQSYNNKSVLVYWDGTTLGEIGRGYGQVAILDTSYNILHNVTLTKGVYAPGINVSSYVDQHEAFITGGSIVVSVYNTTQADLTSVGYTADSWIYDGCAFEIDIASNDVVWHWCASDHSDQIPFTYSHYPITSPPTNASAAWDYFHINSIEPYGDGFLISSRHLWSVIYVDKRTGNVNWILEGGTGGNFTLPTAARFAWQHDPRVLSSSPDGLTITLFNDNNDEATANISAGLQITLDTQTWTATLDAKYYDPALEIAAPAEGGYQPLPDGHVLLCYGIQPYLIEFNGTQSPVWTAKWGVEGDGSYRAYRVNFTGTPTTLPDVAVEGKDNGTYSVYASWNGATEVAQWKIAGCGTTDVVVDKTGFETSYTGECGSAVQAFALSGSGEVLGSSLVVDTS